MILKFFSKIGGGGGPKLGDVFTRKLGGKPLFPMGRWISPGSSLHCTRWAPTSCKWGYNPYKWPYKLVTGAI